MMTAEKYSELLQYSLSIDEQLKKLKECRQKFEEDFNQNGNINSTMEEKFFLTAEGILSAMKKCVRYFNRVK